MIFDLEKPVWKEIDRLIAYFQQNRQDLDFFWRDDDAVAVTLQLKRLYKLAEKYNATILLAVIPSHIQHDLQPYLQEHKRLVPCVHGFSHTNHAPPGEKKAEFGSHRALPILRSEANEALNLFNGKLGDIGIPVFVPPWNRMDEQLGPVLPELGYLGISRGRQAKHIVTDTVT